MNPINKIREGIQLGDWAVVAEGFELLTGESIEPNPDMGTKNNGIYHKTLLAIASQINDALNTDMTEQVVMPTIKKAKKKGGKPSKKEKEEEPEEVSEVKLTATQMPKKVPRATSGGAVNVKDKKMYLPASGDYDPTLAAISKKLAKIKPNLTNRSEYVEEFSTCPKCKQEFSLTKTYPAGSMLKDVNKLICENCMIKNRN